MPHKRAAQDSYQEQPQADEAQRTEDDGLVAMHQGSWTYDDRRRFP